MDGRPDRTLDVGKGEEGEVNRQFTKGVAASSRAVIPAEEALSNFIGRGEVHICGTSREAALLCEREVLVRCVT